ncbi:response regulator transcription factor [Cytobacillus sp. S13-E01]|uniref:response regulator transcription factor n=1 Tax=Cytobacillus sp. S13-E01 TaxID=3031326 RepID=UPI0023D82826|nr:response regulator transcription factor [Cytobacillus sp. S13-E01]MDF0728109.1 response regulator transcription factor [Cytobacillus sp. S13-E01]
MTKILLIDDEQRMLDLLTLYLEHHDYKCIKANSGEEGISYLEENKVDLILLDVMMPTLNGWETAELIRKFSDVPIIMLTARGASTDMVRGLTIGADDYITKPFDESVLIARIQAVLRRTNHTSKLESYGLIWDESNHTLSYNNENIIITPKEFDMVGLLMKNKNIVFSREKLVESIWGYETTIEDRTVDSHVRNIRDKLRKSGFQVEDHLKTVWGVGYKWE